MVCFPRVRVLLEQFHRRRIGSAGDLVAGNLVAAPLLCTADDLVVGDFNNENSLNVACRKVDSPNGSRI
jgi:hypothetical protein